jgi:uncharacterized protein YciI
LSRYDIAALRLDIAALALRERAHRHTHTHRAFLRKYKSREPMCISGRIPVL